MLPGVTVTITNIETGTRAIGHDEHRRTLSRAAASARAVSCRRRAPGFQEVRPIRHRAPGRPDGRDQRDPRGRCGERGDHRDGGVAGRAARQDRPRTHDRTKPRSTTCRCRRAIPTTSRSFRRTSPATRTTSSACRASTPTGRRCTRTISSTATPTPRRIAPGLRLLPISEVLVREVKVVTNGFAPEFGQTTGMVYNAITPVGHQRFSRLGQLPLQAKLDVLAAVLPRADRDQARHRGRRCHGDARRADRQGQRALLRRVRICRSQPRHGRQRHYGQACGCARPSASRCPPSGVIPAHQKVNFAFGKVDYQAGQSTLVTGRYLLFKNFSLSNIGGGLTTTDRATDFTDRMDSASVQAVTTMGEQPLNELRVQFARRHQFRTIGQAVAGPAITVSGVAQFGGPRIGDGNSVGFDFNQKIWQVIDNYTWIAGSHAFKGGIDAQFIGDDRVARREFPIHLPDDRGVSRREKRREPLRLHHAAADVRQPEPELQLAFLRRLRSGRLADRVAHQAAVRRAIRPLRHPAIASRLRQIPYSNNFTDRQEQHRPARGSVLVARLDGQHGPARVDRQDVRAAADRLLRQLDPDQRRSAALQRQFAGMRDSRSVHSGGWRASVPDEPGRAAAWLRAAEAEHHGGRYGLPDAVGLVDQRAAGTRAQYRLVDLGRLRERRRPQPAGVDGRQPDPERADAGRWPSDFLDDPRRTRHSITSTCSSRLANQTTTRLC